MKKLKKKIWYSFVLLLYGIGHLFSHLTDMSDRVGEIWCAVFMVPYQKFMHWSVLLNDWAELDFWGKLNEEQKKTDPEQCDQNITNPKSE